MAPRERGRAKKSGCDVSLGKQESRQIPDNVCEKFDCGDPTKKNLLLSPSVPRFFRNES